ncbi:MAG TPA: hypothetical protein H9912_07290 [Candidatus Eisenbergiella stercorigallinarum]|uniref:Uncharacterized protein n=1 Tax=Candidatus Eisenbergiella stercorigallinarum TaxID=2838557 RepID=A0A9D2R175_9FIRM|nr:hypothetical protein [Candidatus Eisenbergiella stercorigallinarum]
MALRYGEKQRLHHSRRSGRHFPPFLAHAPFYGKLADIGAADGSETEYEFLRKKKDEES